MMKITQQYINIRTTRKQINNIPIKQVIANPHGGKIAIISKAHSTTLLKTTSIKPYGVGMLTHKHEMISYITTGGKN